MTTAMFAAAAVVIAAVALQPRPHRLVGEERPTGRVWLPRLAERRAQRSAERAYPDAIEMIVLAIRAGYLPSAAIGEAIPHLPTTVRPAFIAVTQRTDSGERFADALSALPAALGPIASPLADSFAAADRYGQPLAPVLERLATEARQHRRRQADALARQLPVRMALPLVLCTLPSFIFLAVVPLLLAALSSLHQ
jgi:tight adherence protein C